MNASLRDPAERRGLLRYFYRDWRPTRLGRIWSAIYAFATGLGLGPEALVTLQVKSRTDGSLCSTVLACANYEGTRYVVSMLGHTSQWVQNLRAAGGKAFIKRGRSRPVMLTEIPPEHSAPMLKAWCQVATSGRQHLPVPHDAALSDFAAIAPDYPVFRIDPA